MANPIIVILTPKELSLVCEALDSHAYWNLSDEKYRDSGFVYEPGSDDPDVAAEIKSCEALEDRLRTLLVKKDG